MGVGGQELGRVRQERRKTNTKVCFQEDCCRELRLRKKKRGEGNGNPLQYSCLGNPMTEEPGRLQSMGSQESDTTKDYTIITITIKRQITQVKNARRLRGGRDE